MKKFNIGAKVFKADYGRHEKWVTCPDCLGSKHVTVILGDGTQVIIDCGGCDPGGYEPSKGVIRQYEWSALAKQYTVTGVKETVDSIGYDLDNFGTGSYYTGDNNNVFATEQEALTFGEIEKVRHEAEENKRFMSKTKDGNSWKFNYSYHMRCAKDAERQLQHHQAKAMVCKAKCKEES